MTSHFSVYDLISPSSHGQTPLSLVKLDVEIVAAQETAGIAALKL
jgi:hypothetical protein